MVEEYRHSCSIQRLFLYLYCGFQRGGRICLHHEEIYFDGPTGSMLFSRFGAEPWIKAGERI